MTENAKTFQPAICRLCLSQTLTSFSLISNTETISMLETLTSLRVLPTDEISTVMCLKCRLNLKLAFSIQQSMIKAEQRFHERLLSISIKQEYDPLDSPASDAPLEPEVITLEVKQESDENLKRRRKPRGKYKPRTPKIVPPVTWTCDICGKVKSSKATLRQHKYNTHVKLKCPICAKEITQTNFRHHVNRHKGIRTICELCGDNVRKSDLRIHMANKHRDPIYKCEFCDRVFRQKSRKITHEKRDHLNEADFVCDTCGKKFYQDCDLKRHIEGTHLKLRPFICEFCNVGFSTRFSLKTHRRQHTNETPYKCEVCGEGFRQKVSLKAHLKSKHNIQETLTCECKECGKKFGSNAALFAHHRVHK